VVFPARAPDQPASIALDEDHVLLLDEGFAQRAITGSPIAPRTITTISTCVSECEISGGGVSEHLFQNGPCIPGGSSLTDTQRGRVVGAIRAVFGRS
jgi:hypothetical protein